MATPQNQRRSVSEAWEIAEYPGKPRNIHISRREHQTAINLPVDRQAPPEELQQFSVCDGDFRIHVYKLFVRASDDQRLPLLRFSKETREQIVETMYRMFVPRNYPEEDAIPGAVLVPMIPYEDSDIHEKVTVISTLSFNSLGGLQTVFVAPVDSGGRVDITRTRACRKDALIPLDGPEVQKREAIRDIHGFFLQGISPTEFTISSPCLETRQEREPYDKLHVVVQMFGDILLNKEVDEGEFVQKLRDLPRPATSGQQGGTAVPTEGLSFQNTTQTNEAMLEHESHLSQRGQQASPATGHSAEHTGDGSIHREITACGPVIPLSLVIPIAVEQDLSVVGVLRHFNREKATFGTHVRMCPLCRSKAGRLFHASTCRASNCQRCNSVALEVARHMGRCDDPSCPIFGPICAGGLGIPLFVPETSQPTLAFVSLVRLDLAQILHFDT